MQNLGNKMLGKKLSEKRDFVQAQGFKTLRSDKCFDEKWATESSPYLRHAELLEKATQLEEPIILDDDVFAFARSSNQKPPAQFSGDELAIVYGHDSLFHDPLNNCCPDYSILLTKGLLGLQEEVLNALKNTHDQKQKEFLIASNRSIVAVLNLAQKYAKVAKEKGLLELSSILENVPAKPATTLREGLQSIRFVSAMFYLTGNFQLGFGRMDQYLLPLYMSDRENKNLKDEEVIVLLQEFFLSLNRDIDLYPGVTTGDNGQTVVLGGTALDGSSAVNPLTYLIIKASLDLNLIDPKINLRVRKDTPEDLLMLACELTKKGLGFPQYLNDEVIIPGLVKAGYALEHARDYSVAACWEFVIPGQSLDVVNQGAVSFPYAVDNAVRRIRKNNFTLSEFDSLIRDSISEQVKSVINRHNVSYLPAPFVSLFFKEPLKVYLDITDCAIYKNVGIHGAASASGVDAYMAARHFIETGDFEEFNRMRIAVSNNFIGFDSERSLLLNLPHKVGNDDEDSNKALKKLFDIFAEECEKCSTSTKKIRPGSGSAQFYVWLAQTQKNFNFLVEPRVAATFDGRVDKAPFSSSLAPANEVKVRGILSVLKTFSNLDYSKIVNGGPITVEFAPKSLSSQEGLKKLSSLIRYFVALKNQELQLNVLDVKQLEDALLHPERHRNLIVRVWGWSGYFCELPREFQEQIIKRHQYTL